MDLQSFLIGFVLVGFVLFYVNRVVNPPVIDAPVIDSNWTASKTSAITSPEDFYERLFFFIFEFKGPYLYCLRTDLSDTMNSQIYEIFSRSDNLNLFKNLTVKLNSDDHSTNGCTILKASSLLTTYSISEMERKVLCEETQIMGTNMRIISERFIFVKRVFEVIAINQDIAQDVSKVTNDINKYDPPLGSI